MRTLLLAALPCLSLGTAARGQVDAPTSTDALDIRAIDRYVTDRMRATRIPGLSLVVVKGDRLVYAKGYGRADPSGRPVTPQTPFMIGSITKAFTALAVMQLVDAGRVDLDAPVQRYIPWFRVADPAASAQLTVRHLLTMTSGLPQVYETQLSTAQDDRAIERNVRSMRTARLRGPPGRTFGYSNANYEILGMIVQSVSGLSYEDWVKREIFAPLDMRNSFVSETEALRHGMATGHRWWFGIPVPADIPYNRAELPAGYIIASAEDMSHFLIAQMNAGRYGDASVISLQGMAATHVEPAENRYGVGWESIRDDGHRLINHDGGTFDFQSSLFFDPEARVGVFMAANVISALDAFSSPPGSSRLDGQTTRAMAHTVLNLATNRPLPDQGPGHERLTRIFNLMLLALSGALVLSLARVRARHARWEQHASGSRRGLAWRGALVTASNVAVPIGVAFLVLAVPAWKVVATFQPDLAYWLYAVAAILFVKGMLELAWLRRAFRQSHAA